MSDHLKLPPVDLLGLLDQPEYTEVARGFREKRWPKKTIVSTPYDEGDRILIVKSGRLRIFLCYDDREFTLALLGPGDIFSTHTRAFVEALDESILLLGDTQNFQRKAMENPAIGLVMVKVLGELLKNSITLIEGLAFKDARMRLVDFLVNAAADRGRSHPRGLAVELRLTTEEIALLVGTSRQTVSTLLNELIKGGVVDRLDRQTLVVLDLARLKSLNSPP